MSPATTALSTSPTSSTGFPLGGNASSASITSHQQQQGGCRYVQYAVDAVGAESAGLYCLWDGQQVCSPGVVLPTS
jgi:hypothetical protein